MNGQISFVNVIFGAINLKIYKFFYCIILQYPQGVSKIVFKFIAATYAYNFLPQSWET